MSKAKIILIAGPTASGKSALALDLARKTNGVIINADSMQIYAGLPILTAQPDAEEQKQIPHRLYGTVDPAEKSSAGRWLTFAQEAIKETVAQNRTPILVGGTGLYFRALLGGLADIPTIPDEVRKKSQTLYERIGEEKFRKELAQLDPESAARLAKNDRQRLIRSYEVVAHTGKPIAFWHKRDVMPAQAGIPFVLKENGLPAFAGVTFSVEPYLLMPLRDELYAACDRRFEEMIQQGAIEEVRKFLERKLDPALPAMKVLGVREIGAHLNGEMTLEQAITKAQQATRNYAKRQMTWFRNQWPFK